jgi:hypothetical protein
MIMTQYSRIYFTQDQAGNLTPLELTAQQQLKSSWINALSPEERSRWDAAVIRQNIHAVSDDNSSDPEFTEMWHRYLEENHIVVEFAPKS